MISHQFVVLICLTVFVSAAGGGVYTVALFTDSSTVDGQFSTVEMFTTIEHEALSTEFEADSVNGTVESGNQTITETESGSNETVPNGTVGNTPGNTETITGNSTNPGSFVDNSSESSVSETPTSDESTDSVTDETETDGTETATESDESISEIDEGESDMENEDSVDGIDEGESDMENEDSVDEIDDGQSNTESGDSVDQIIDDESESESNSDLGDEAPPAKKDATQTTDRPEPRRGSRSGGPGPTARRRWAWRAATAPAGARGPAV